MVLNIPTTWFISCHKIFVLLQFHRFASSNSFTSSLNRSFSIYAEYNFARDDDSFNNNIKHIIYRKGDGYLNAGLRWSATNNIMLEMNINDMAKNNKVANAMSRELKVIYFEQF